MKTKHSYKRLFLLFGEEENLITRIKTKEGKNHKLLYPKYAYILHLLIHKFTFDRDRYDKEGKRLHVKNLRGELGWKESLIAEIIGDLMRWGYVRYFSQPVKGMRATGYKLAPAYEESRFTIRLFHRNEAAFLRRLVERERKQRRPETHKRLQHVYDHHVSISEEGLQYLEDRYPFEATKSLTSFYREKKEKSAVIDALNDLLNRIPIERGDMPFFSFLTKDYYINQPKVSQRLFNTFCNLKREHRPFILLGGQPHLNTDIVNSQVTFSIPVIQGAIRDAAAKDFLRYQHLATSGRFYEFLAEAVGVDIQEEEARTKFKKDFFGAVFFSQPSNKKSRIKSAFEKRFPTVHEAINKIKHGNYKRFAIKLQNLEADVVIFDALKNLQEEGHLAIPLHDAVYVNNPASLLRAKEIIRANLRSNYGLLIAFKDEDNISREAELLTGSRTVTNIKMTAVGVD